MGGTQWSSHSALLEQNNSFFNGGGDPGTSHCNFSGDSRMAVLSVMLRGCRGAGCQDSLFQSRIQVLLTCCGVVWDATTLRVGEADGLQLPRVSCPICNFENSVIWILLPPSL